MALTTTESRIADRITLGSFMVGTGAITLAFAADNSIGLLAISTGASALGAASMAARHLYDHAGQKIVEWKVLRMGSEANRASTAKEVAKVAERLQSLESGIDNRIDVVSNSASRRAQVSMGAWVQAANTLLNKAPLFDVAASYADKDPLKLPANWSAIERDMTHRVASYGRMLKADPLQWVSDTNVDLRLT